METVEQKTSEFFSLKSNSQWSDVPTFGKRVFVGAVIVSMFVHIIGLVLSWLHTTHDPFVNKNSQPVKIRISQPTTDALNLEKSKRMVETPQTETAPPKDADYLGPQDHSTLKETKLAKRFLNDEKALDPGQRGVQEAAKNSKVSNPLLTAPRQPSQMASSQQTPAPMMLQPGAGTLSMPKSQYEKLLPSSDLSPFGKENGGYTEMIDAPIPEGDRFNMNTAGFKFISYFTGMRKDIERVWIYPREAVERGLSGQVHLELIIEKDGTVSKVRVVKSSGFAILDENIVRTIRQASPFSPIPKGWKKDRIQVTGEFHYVLAAH